MTQEKGINEVMQMIVNGGAHSVILSTTMEVGVKVCNGKMLPGLLRFASRLSEDLGLSLKDAEGIKDKLLSKVDDVSFILKLIANYTDDVYTLVGSMTTLGSVDAVSELAVDDLCKVIVKVVEVNQDFFMRRVLPLFRSLRATQELSQ